MASLALSLLIGLIAHFVGDYLLQSHWMATLKTTKWLPAIVHGVTYTLPFLFATQSPLALVVICVTHILIDRFRLAKYLVWLKNQMGPKNTRPVWPWKKFWRRKPKVSMDTLKADNLSVATSSVEDVNASSSLTANTISSHQIHILDHNTNCDKATGYPTGVPAWMGVWLMIIADNTLHIIINSLAIWLA